MKFWMSAQCAMCHLVFPHVSFTCRPTGIVNYPSFCISIGSLLLLHDTTVSWCSSLSVDLRWFVTAIVNVNNIRQPYTFMHSNIEIYLMVAFSRLFKYIADNRHSKTLSGFHVPTRRTRFRPGTWFNPFVPKRPIVFLRSKSFLD